MKVQQNGQSSVEFALVLPLFLLFFMAIAYLGMVFADYLTLSNIARDSARYAAVSASTTDVSTIRTKYNNDHSPSLITSLYKWNSSIDDDFNIKLNQGTSPDQYVEVTLTATLADSTNIMGLVLPSQLKVDYKMHQE